VALHREGILLLNKKNAQHLTGTWYAIVKVEGDIVLVVRVIEPFANREIEIWEEKLQALLRWTRNELCGGLIRSNKSGAQIGDLIDW